jgi:tetratricopeptide (TPR) repeat protein
MQPGQTVGGRFVLERLAGRGGMGSVFRAIDTAAGGEVALKILDPAPPGAADRFLREAKVLSRVSHPKIVRYVAQGADGACLWLAMEWVEGVTLAQALEGGALDLASALLVAEQIASGLAESHRLGIVHRDIKPSNVVLKGGRPGDVRIIDFGIAHVAATTRLTAGGHFVGTAGYMSPEQIATPESVDARVDLFALGCVLFEALTGTPAFPGESAVAIMAKVLAHEPPRPSLLAPAVPAPVEELVLRLLAKRREDRPDSVAEVEALLAHLRTAAPGAGSLPPRITRREQRLVSVVLATTEHAADTSQLQRAISAAAAVQARVYPIDQLAHLFVLETGRSADEEAARAAECAIVIQRALPSARLAVATGLVENDTLTVGPAIDKCAALLTRGGAPGSITVDDVTAGLLRSRFELDVQGGVTTLGATRSRVAPSHPPGDAAPPIGRDKELRFLQAEIDQAIDEPTPRALLITGEAGSGKSRVLEHLLAAARTRGVAVHYARASVLGAGSPLATARQLVRHAARVQEDTPPEAVRAAVLARLGAAFEMADRARSADFLTELVAGGALTDVAPEVVAGRNEPRILADWLRRTFVDWLCRESRERPVVVALEDLHWSDGATIAWLGEALRGARDLPLVVLATGRPETHDALPGLRQALQPQELRLGPLGKKASEMLAQSLLGQGADKAQIERIVELSGGNPFFLEELSRRGRDTLESEASPTLLTILQSRIGQLDPGARRALRAASVFGRTFHTDGVTALLGDEVPEVVARQLRTLTSEEIVEPARTGDFDDWSFRHDLLRDASYATLPEPERARGHGAAAAWLKARGGAEPLCIADHLERAGRGNEAAEHLVQAAERAQSGGSLHEALALLERALLRTTDEHRGRLMALKATIHAMMRDWTAARAASAESLAIVVPGTVDWFRAAAIQVFARLTSRDTSAIGRAAQALRAVRSTPAPTGPYAFAIMGLVVSLGMAGERGPALEVLSRIEEQLERPQRDPAFVAWGRLALSHADLFLRDDPAGGLQNAERAVELGEGLGDRLLLVLATFFSAQAMLECGDARAAADLARRLQAQVEVVPYLQAWSIQIGARVQLAAGDADGALETIEVTPGTDQPQFRARLLMIRARVAASRGDVSTAKELASDVEGSLDSPLDAAHAAALLAALALEEGDLAEAERHIGRGLELAAAHGAFPTNRSSLQLRELQLLARSGRTEALAEKAALAAARVLAVAARMPSPALRDSWLALPDHRAIVGFGGARAGAIAPAAAAAPPATTAPVWDEESTVDVTGFGGPPSGANGAG